MRRVLLILGVVVAILGAAVFVLSTQAPLYNESGPPGSERVYTNRAPERKEPPPEEEPIDSETSTLELWNTTESGVVFYVDDSFACELREAGKCGLEFPTGWHEVSATANGQTHTARECISQQLLDEKLKGRCDFHGDSLRCSNAEVESCE